MAQLHASILRPMTPLHRHRPTVNAIAEVLSDADGMVCDVCGLELLGHHPESQWLGHDPHEWTPRVATAADLRRADELSRQAYRARPGRDVAD